MTRNLRLAAVALAVAILLAVPASAEAQTAQETRNVGGGALLTSKPTAGGTKGLDGCTAWGNHSRGIGRTTCRWEAEGPGGFWASGIVKFRIHRGGEVLDRTWYVSCAAPQQPPVSTWSYFEQGDVVEVTVEAGWATVGSHAGYPCW